MTKSNMNRIDADFIEFIQKTLKELENEVLWEKFFAVQYNVSVYGWLNSDPTQFVVLNFVLNEYGGLGYSFISSSNEYMAELHKRWDMDGNPSEYEDMDRLMNFKRAEEPKENK